MSSSPRKKRPLSDSGPPMSPLPSTVQKPNSMDRIVMPILIVLYLVFASIHALVTPIGQTGYQDAPDEAAHVSYVRSLSVGHLPSQAAPAAPGDIGQHYEWHQPPLYYALDVPFLALGERAARFLSILCGVVCLLLIDRTVRLFAPDDPFLAIVAVGIAALTPGHVSITSTVNNDVLLEVWFSAVILLLISSLKDGFTFRRACWLGVCIGAAIMTKLTGLLLLPVAAFGFLLCIRQGERARNVLKNSGVSLLIALLLSGPWIVRNVSLYHEPVPLHAFQQAFGSTAQASRFVHGEHGQHGIGWGGYYLVAGELSFQSFWATYGDAWSARHGGVPLFLPDSVYILMAVVCVVVIAGMVRLHFRRMTAFTEYQRYALRIQFLVIGLVALAFAGFLSHYFQVQGRYLYPAMSGITMVMSLGWLAMFPERYRRLAGGLLLTVLALLCMVLLLTITNHP